MASKPVPLLGRVLTVLRSALGWEQHQLAEAAGLKATVVSDYERGHRRLSRERLETLVRVMGVPALAVDLCLGFLQTLDAVVQPPGHPGSFREGQRQKVEAVAGQAAQLASQFARTLLHQLTHEGRALAARELAERQWGAMRRREPAARRVLVEDTQAYRNWALCERVCAESVKAAADNADRAVELAELAVLIAGLVPGEEAWRQRLQGYARAHLGNALRVRTDWRSADEAFHRARELWEAGAPGDPGLLAEAQVLSLEASLRIDQDRLGEAATLLDRALAADAGGLRPNLLVKRARVLLWGGNYEGSLAMLRQAEPLPPERQEPRLVWMVRISCALNLCHLERYAEAEALLPEVRALTAQLGNALDTLRLHWLEGQVAAGLGRADGAVAALSRARAGFAEQGIAYDTALVTLELSVVHLQQERTREVQRLARQMAPIFKAQGVHREALAALKIFCEAAEKEAATVELARRVVDYLYRAQHNPELRFEAGR